ncbi:TIR domain-containing protein [Erysipelothrix rhusiopathiae]|nr:TIR domain-containing protein [Erysipelothrix rhusiopathiae]MDE8203858.1 TIR domain-containing protein [Erysipelothrix rhusiopathiae]MDE8258470.1 TIR domain-containing protein [Erysipelothrix rhusiopathiae]MDE8272356.1 TIR domain-containing protein [Erysipelothrix rhusiopathiae]MDE8301486.1 TIR domain-containing protein [Erysipelothrix rhusiopathiae]
MKVFISWSKDYSKEIATEVKKWVKSVIQATNPFVSDSDIDLGTLPLNKIDEQLIDSKLGIIIVTSENYKSPWINYEAGAISNVVPGETKVIPILFGIDIQSLGSDPLTKFQMAKEFNKETMLRVVKSINNELEANRLEEKILAETFELWWPSLDEKILTIISKHSDKDKNDNPTSVPSEKSVDQAKNFVNGGQLDDLISITDRNSRMIQEISTLLHSNTIDSDQTEVRIERIERSLLSMISLEKQNIIKMDQALNNLDAYYQTGDESLVEFSYEILKEVRENSRINLHRSGKILNKMVK